MSKQPSAETQLKQLKAQYNRTEDQRVEALRDLEFYRLELADVRKQLERCEAERVKLLDALCAREKREQSPVKSRAVDPSAKLVSFRLVSDRKIAAIRALRAATPVEGSVSGVKLGLAEAKDIIERGTAYLTEAERAAIEPYVEFSS